MTNNNSKYNALMLTRGRILVRSTVFSLLGQFIPLIVAFFAYPILIKGLGTERFGILILIWLIIGYFNIFDLNVGRAVTKLIAERLGSFTENDEDIEISYIFWTSELFLFALGIIVSINILLISHMLIYNILKIPDIFKQETLSAFFVLALTVPLSISIANMRGVLSAYQKFGKINIIQTFNGVFSFLAPIGVLQFSSNLFFITISLAIVRLIFFVFYLLLCFHTVPQIRKIIKIKPALLKQILFLGGWMTVSSIVNPILVYFDRFFISTWISIAAVAYYSTAFEVITKVLIFPASIVRVLFPAFAITYKADPKKSLFIYNRSQKFTFIFMFPIILLLVSFSNFAFKLWLGNELAQHCFRIFQWLALGVLVNCLSFISFSSMRAIGRPDIPAKLNFFEIFPYILLLWILTSLRGLEGAAIAWTLRIVIDSVVLFIISNRLFNNDIPYTQRAELFLFPGVITLLFIMFLTSPITIGIFIFFVFIGFILFSWYLLFDINDRNMITKNMNFQSILSIVFNKK